MKSTLWRVDVVAFAKKQIKQQLDDRENASKKEPNPTRHLSLVCSLSAAVTIRTTTNYDERRARQPHARTPPGRRR
jgi:hypothetical protein